MAELCYEFASWPASEDYQKDQGTVASALDVLKAKTPYRIWSGLGTWPDERPTYWSIVAWETSATHAAFKKDLPNYNKMMAGFASSFAEKENPTLLLIYTHFGIDPSAVFDTPATAVTVVKSKEGISLEKAKAVLDNTCQALSATSESPKVAWATVESQPDLFVLAEGWETDISGTTRDLTELLNNFTVDTPTALVRLNKVQ